MTAFVNAGDPKVSVVGKTDDDGEDTADVGFTCWLEGGGCGRKGTLAEMLIHEDNDQFFCPECGSGYDWIWD